MQFDLFLMMISLPSELLATKIISSGTTVSNGRQIENNGFNNIRPRTENGPFAIKEDYLRKAGEDSIAMKNKTPIDVEPKIFGSQQFNDSHIPYATSRVTSFTHQKSTELPRGTLLPNPTYTTDSPPNISSINPGSADSTTEIITTTETESTETPDETTPFAAVRPIG